MLVLRTFELDLAINLSEDGEVSADSDARTQVELAPYSTVNVSDFTTFSRYVLNIRRQLLLLRPLQVANKKSPSGIGRAFQIVCLAYAT